MIDSGSEFLPSHASQETLPNPTLPQRKDATSGPVVTSIQDNTAKITEVRRELRTGEYTGEIGDEIRRGIKGYEKEWNVEKEIVNISFDQLVSDAIENAVTKGKKEVLIFDFGCGQATAFEDFLLQSDSKAQQLIRDHPEIQVKLLGLTDTPGVRDIPDRAETLVQGRDLKSSEAEPKNLSAHVDYYFVSKEQTLEQYFDAKGITQIDAIMAVQSLPYPDAEDFEVVLQTMIDKLSPGGVLLAAPYATRVPGFARDSTIIGGKPRFNFDDPPLDLDPKLIPMFKEKGMRFSLPDINVKQEGEQLKAAFDFFVKEGSLSQEDVDDRISEYLPQLTKLWNGIRNKPPQLDQLFGKGEETIKSLSRVAGLLIDGEANLGIKRLDALAKQKREVLAKLKTKHEDDAEMKFGDDVIHVKKK